jgi:hypothetical protein
MARANKLSRCRVSEHLHQRCRGRRGGETIRHFDGEVRATNDWLQRLFAASRGARDETLNPPVGQEICQDTRRILPYDHASVTTA